VLVVVVLAAFVLGAAGFGAFVIHRESTATSRPTRPKRVKGKRPLKADTPAPSDETDTESADDVLDHPEKLLDGTHTGPCRPLPAAVAKIRVRGIDIETMLRRLETAGYACTSRTDNDIPGARNTVFIVGNDDAWVMMVVMASGENIMGSGAGGRLVTDPNGASVAFAEPDGAKAAEVIFGK
jgi:hypothetical protein